MQNKPDISVIVPTYKPGKYIQQCLLSLAGQTLPNDKFEVIVILNGCNEPYRSQISQIIDNQMSSLDVKLLHTDVPGVSNARNIGIDNAKGRFVTFLDDDDYLSDCFLEKMLLIAEKNIIPMSNVVSFSDTDNSVLPYYVSEAFKHLYNKGVVNPLKARSFLSVCVAKLIPMEIIGTTRFSTNLKRSEDSLFMFTLSKDIKSMECAENDAVYFRRIRSNSATTASHSLTYRIGNFLKMSSRYCGVFFRHPFKYSIVMLMTRIGGAAKHFLS